jgi:hypothetical protein
MSLDDVQDTELTCSVCQTTFDESSEGGIQGYFGIIPVSFCPTCLSCMLDMASQLQGLDDINDYE